MKRKTYREILCWRCHQDNNNGGQWIAEDQMLDHQSDIHERWYTDIQRLKRIWLDEGVLNWRVNQDMSED